MDIPKKMIDDCVAVHLAGLHILDHPLDPTALAQFIALVSHPLYVILHNNCADTALITRDKIHLLKHCVFLYEVSWSSARWIVYGASIRTALYTGDAYYVRHQCGTKPCPRAADFDITTVNKTHHVVVKYAPDIYRGFKTSVFDTPASVLDDAMVAVSKYTLRKYGTTDPREVAKIRLVSALLPQPIAEEITAEIIDEIIRGHIFCYTTRWALTCA